MRIIILLALLLPFASQASNYKEIDASWVFSTENNFESALENLVFAIESRGLVISYTAHASEMLNRTASAVGTENQVYGDAQILLFCKSDLSHAMVADNPHHLPLCPYSISIYTIFQQPELTYLSIRKPDPAAPFSNEIAKLLISIIEEAQDGF